MNEITISKSEYDELKAYQIMLTLYKKALIKCSRYSEWRKSGVTIDDEDVFDLIEFIDYPTAADIETRCAEMKEREEKAKAEAKAEAEKKAKAEAEKAGAFPEV